MGRFLAINHSHTSVGALRQTPASSIPHPASLGQTLGQWAISEILYALQGGHEKQNLRRVRETEQGFPSIELLLRRSAPCVCFGAARMHLMKESTNVNPLLAPS